MLDLPHGPGPMCPSLGTAVIKPNGESGRKLYSFAVYGSAKGAWGKPGATRRTARHKSSGWLGGIVCATFNDRNSSLTVSPDMRDDECRNDGLRTRSLSFIVHHFRASAARFNFVASWSRANGGGKRMGNVSSRSLHLKLDQHCWRAHSRGVWLKNRMTVRACDPKRTPADEADRAAHISGAVQARCRRGNQSWLKCSPYRIV